MGTVLSNPLSSGTKALKNRKLPHKQALSLAAPMTLANISVPLMGLADTAMLGQLNNPAFLGGVAVGANIFALLFWMLAFLRMSTTSLVGQYYGAGRLSSAMDALVRSVCMACVIAAAIVLLHPLYLDLAISLIGQDESVRFYASQYSNIRIFSSFAVLMTYVFLGWLMGVQSMRAILVITLSMNACNIGLDYLFIIHFDWEVKGAAWATVISEYVGLAIAGVLFVHSARSKLAGTSIGLILSRFRPSSMMGVLKKNELQALGKMNSHLFLRTFLLLAVFNFFTAKGGGFSNEILAANAILIQLMFIGTFAIDGYAYAGETMVAHATGQKNLRQLHNITLATHIVGIGISVICSLCFYFIKPLALVYMTSIEGVRAELEQYYFWIYFMPIAAVMCYLLDGIFIGAGKTRALRDWMIFSVLGVFVPCWWAFSAWGNHGLWLAFLIFHIARGVTLLYMYDRFTRRKVWFG